MSDKKNTVIFISGRGSNMEALVEAAQSPTYPANIVGVISNKADAAGLQFAKQNNIPSAVFCLRDFAGKPETDAAIDQQLRAWNTDLVCLAGFMRLLGDQFCTDWHGKILNIHPSLLPDFKGLDTHRRALDAEVSEHGCSVHFVTTELDDGPIVGQVAVPVEYGDSPASLEDRVRLAEHKLYPWALAQVASDAVSIETARKNA